VPRLQTKPSAKHVDVGTADDQYLPLILLALAWLFNCSTPVARKFPDAPGTVAMTACPQLQKLTEDAKLSDISKTVSVNYGTYYECAVKTDAWIEWYKIQQEIFNKVK
jgi:hypothetical protein